MGACPVFVRPPAPCSAPRHDPQRVLIVCEGERTEPAYFRGLVDCCRAGTAGVEVEGFGWDPHKVVRHAKTRQNREKRRGERYDEVYCVFDRDEHPNFNDASRDAETNGLRLARSWPCFEFWFLLHFEYSRRPYGSGSGRSPCENRIEDLRQHLGEYAKAAGGMFERLEDRRETSMSNARRAMDDARKTGEDNPSTEVHELVEYLRNLGSGAEPAGGDG